MKQLLYSCILMLVLSACGGVDVQTEVGNGANLARLTSYAWLDTDETSLKGVRPANPDVNEWVKTAVENQLEKKGYTMVPSEQAEFLISWIGSIEQKIQVQSVDHFYRSYGYGAVASSMPLVKRKGDTTREYQEGTIILDVLDPESNTMLWRSSGTDRLLQGLDKEETVLYVNRLVKNILKTFPEAKK